ncbi:hypothetical protein GCM10011366_02170 [Ornithinimicrobium tianjinense]|uniref:Uncharacterized protein n=2 Tax=Ornithinimicrobium tianjinense TaxID=1195761 RepID=A0A917BGG0_9MICO|nr:hypothetical protein GCM10011366_02170 [Ornithinimicrobium tianjinense]
MNALLLRVAGDVFGDRVSIEAEGNSPSMPHAYVVRRREGGRNAVLVASHEWSEAHIVDFRVTCTVFHYGDDEMEKESALRALAVVLRAYMAGQGQVEHRPSLLWWRPDVPRYTVTIDGFEWRLGRHGWVTPI